MTFSFLAFIKPADVNLADLIHCQSCDQYVVINGLSVLFHKPPVSLYMSLTVRVARFVSGFPLSPPVSFLFVLFKVSGLETVVFVTMRPSTPP